MPPSMASQAEKVAKKQGMTRSELLRYALRRYIEELQAGEAIRVAEEEYRSGKAKVLSPKGLARLLNVKK